MMMISVYCGLKCQQYIDTVHESLIVQGWEAVVEALTHMLYPLNEQHILSVVNVVQ